ncbi:MAG: aminomethyl transferase family protein, partial [Proteobacteria bacterium]|nr:aminomethyl transferase family protein [Pseudomonadota bacterium]
MIETNLRATPFHPRLAAFNANHNWERWEGWLSVGAFDNAEREYFAIRNAATLYDISPITQYEITGPQAAAFMDRLVTRDMNKVRIGRAAYALWCDDNGKVVEDGTVFRLEQNRFLVNVQEHNLVWFEDTAFGMDVAIADVSDRWAGLSVQG